MSILFGGTAFAALLKSGAGVGAGLFLLPVLNIIFDPFSALAVTVPLLSIMDVLAVVSHWNQWLKPPMLTRLMCFSVSGVTCGILAIPYLSANALCLLIGGVGMSYALSNLLSFRIPFASADPTTVMKKNRTACWAAFLGGLFNIVNAGSLFYAFGLMRLNLSNQVFVATLCLLIFVVNFVKAAGFFCNDLLTPELLLTALKLIPVIIIGSYLGSRIVPKLPSIIFRRLVLLLILVMSTKTFFSAL